MEARAVSSIHRVRGLGADRAARSDARMRAIVGALIVAALGCAAAKAQGTSAAELRETAHAAVARDVDPAAREAQVEALLGSDAGAAALLLAARGELDPATRRWRAERTAHLRGFAKAAARALRERRGKDGELRIATLRRECLAVTRGEGLTKDAIHDVIDPRLAELETLFAVDVDAVRVSAADVASESDRLQAEAARLVDWFLLAERCERALLATPNGQRFLRAHALADDPREFAAELLAEERRLAAAATLIDARDQRVLERNAVLAAELVAAGFDPEESKGIAELNRIRMRLGLGVLALDDKLCAAARDHSEDMVKLGFFAHESPVPGKRTPGERAARFGTSAGAENIAFGQADGHEAITAWWYSPGHHRNLLSGAARVGLGRAGHHWTQMFGG